MKTFIKKTIAVVSIIAIALTLAMPMQAEAATKVKLNKTKATLTMTDKKISPTVQLKVTGTSKKVTWTSSNKTVATVSSKGKVTAMNSGSATITAKVSGKKYTCKVKVTDKTTYPTITVTKKTKSASLTKVKTGSYKLSTVTGASIQFKAKAGKTVVTKKATWKSSNTKVVSVTKAGKLTAKKVGSAKITCTYKGKKTTLNVTVKCSGHKWVKHYTEKTVPVVHEEKESYVICNCGAEFANSNEQAQHAYTIALQNGGSATGHEGYSNATRVVNTYTTYETQKVCDYTYCSVCGAHK